MSFAETRSRRRARLTGWPHALLLCLALVATASSPSTVAAPATLVFEDDFNRGIPGWTAVQPAGNYLDGPMRWQYDIVSGAFLEQSNIYTDAAAASPSATAVMLINDTVASTNFTYRARLTAGDDDAFGLIFGYRDANNFYRVTFTRQQRTDPGYPWNGWNVDRKVANVATNLFGHGTPDHVDSFVNTQYQPFEVTLTVTGENLFSLTVLDDPDGARTEYRLVESQPLPGPANGRVGLTTWGMSGTALRGFRIAQPTLEPLPLTGDPNALPQWTPVITKRNDGSGLDSGSGNGGVPIWSLALGQSGAFGTLHENSDSFGGNDADGSVDFAAGALVAGDLTWSNVVVSTRILPADDDGQGLLVRYRDESNFYRIALRSQNSGTGPARGLSVQKVVNGTAEEVFREATPAYDPVANVPYDLTAAMIGDRLQIQLIVDPNGAARVFSYGPFDLTGATLATGRVGLFSWGMSRTEFDFIRVHTLEGLPLVVSSAYGSPVPSAGLQGFPSGTTVTASVASPLEERPGLRRVVTGWTGLGSVPATGSVAQVEFVLNEISSLTWNWRTEVLLNVTAAPGGRAQSDAGDWIPEGTALMVTATPDTGYLFTHWSGDIASNQSTLVLRPSRPLQLTANFAADSDSDGLPDSWEIAELGGTGANPGDDPDNDGRTLLEEYRAGTDPNHAEVVSISTGLSSRWENVQRDPALPGQLVVRDFGNGFRGVWENSNDFREAVDGRFIGTDFTVPGVSFEGPRLVIRTNHWNPSWKNSTASTVFSVGDNDGNCVYFRYRDELNWYRVTVCGENNNLDWRAPFGVTLQKRSQGVFTEIAEDASIATDPTDLSFYKRVRVTVTARDADFEVRVTGWNALVTPPAWDVDRELVLTFSDPDHAEGRFGIGTWGQSGGGPATETNPVNAGVLIESVVIEANGTEVFREDWNQVPLAAELPAGWTNPQTGSAAGTWQVTAHGSILQTANYSTATTGTLSEPRADGEGSILLSPEVPSPNQFLEFGFHPFDDDGIGFVYDFQDTNNFARVLFVSEPSANGRVPQGVNVSRKINGAWTDLVVADTTFAYRNGVPFTAALSHRNGAFVLTVRDGDDATRTATSTWIWTDTPIGGGRRFGLTVWGETDAHFTQAQVSPLPSPPVSNAPRIAAVRLTAGTLTLEIENSSGRPYAVEFRSEAATGSWVTLADNQTAAQWTVTLDAGTPAGFYRLRQLP